MNGRPVIMSPSGQRGFGSCSVLVAVLFMVAVAGVAWVYMGMVTRDRWPIRWLEIDGSFERVSAEQVRASLAPLVKGSFFTVNLDAVSAAGRKLAWVEDVVVQKLWPDTVRVTIREFVPLAHWIDGQLLSPQGHPFKVPGANEMQGLPWLEGPPGMLDEVYQTWMSFNNELQPTGLEIDRIRLDRRGAWSLELSNGTQVQIGRADPLPRLRRMVTSWPELLRGQELVPLGLDLRYTNGFAVRWPAPVTQVAQGPR